MSKNSMQEVLKLQLLVHRLYLLLDDRESYPLCLQFAVLISRPWTGNSTQCFLSQFNNAMYVLGADSSDMSVSSLVIAQSFAPAAHLQILALVPLPTCHCA
jgi:hypothetical protein